MQKMFQLAEILTLFDTYVCLFHFTSMHLSYQGFKKAEIKLESALFS
jgi:hypothetical protein